MINESILDPVQPKLNPAIWRPDGKLRKTVKIHIIKQFENWLKNYTNVKPTAMYLLGSNAGYQYNSTSDIDINVELPLKEEDRRKLRKNLPNGKLLPGTKHPINYYISGETNRGWQNEADYYDIFKDKWVRKPNKIPPTTPALNFKVVAEVSRFFIAGFDAMISEYNSDVAAYNVYKKTFETENLSKEDEEAIRTLIRFKIDEIISDIDGLAIAEHLLRALRKEAFLKNEYFDIASQIVIKDKANFSINNLIYKYLEKLDYPDKVLPIINKKDKWVEIRKKY